MTSEDLAFESMADMFERLRQEGLNIDGLIKAFGGLHLDGTSCSG
jgi:hypothetical protein